MYLPRIVEDLAQSAESAGEQSLASQKIPGVTILVVEDEPLVRLGTVAMLDELGYTVREAASGAEALVALEADPSIQLLLSDEVMPGMNGKQLATEARRRRPGLKVLFATGYTRNVLVHDGRLDPGVQLINKLFSLTVLAEKVAEVLSTPAG